ncbi:hypothetical protein LSCM1_05947 [Leishmania martiniquensis]|uniref:Uncharacterized protein n=1 Tax=Leishmania martiniquensis TaxID=1580590 RepID=A0A836GLA4_9TRYP|nr:hypothetical protein LSCM1_05947 [Leishmania martiniquensis]
MTGMSVAVATGSLCDSGGQAQQAAHLFLRDVKHLLRWHAAVVGVALAATPVVYQVARVVAHRHRAELVNLAKDTVQLAELFNGAEADGAQIYPAEAGRVSITYNSGAKDEQEAGGNAGDGTLALWTGSSRSASHQPASIFALRMGRRHSWVVSSIAHRVLAAQRAPNRQFVRTCSLGVVYEYGVVVLRAATTSLLVSVASLTVFYAGCRALDQIVPFGAPPAAAVAKGAAPMLLLDAFATEPLFITAAPPSPAVNSIYGLYSFSVSAAGVWSRLFPRFGAIQTLWQRLTGCTQPLHAEWREGPAAPSSSSRHALADSVWASLSPRGYFMVSLLPRVSSRIAAGLWWLTRRTSTVLMRHWCTASSPASSTAKAPTPTNGAAADPGTPALSQRRRRRRPTKLIHSPVAKTGMMLAGDVVFAGIVFLATSCASSTNRSGSSSRWPLVRNDANARYDFYCWAEAICSTLSMVGL